MKRALIDPLVLAAPSRGANQSEVEAYLNQLLQVEELEKAECIGLAISARAMEVLANADAYPIVDRYPRARFPQRADVLRIVFGIAKRLPYIEDLLGFLDLLASDVVCEPAPISQNRSHIFEEHFQYLCASIAVAASLTNPPLLHMIVSAFDVEDSECRASGILEDVEWNSLHLPAGQHVQLPLSFSIIVSVVNNAAGLLRHEDLPVTLWLETGDFAGALRILLHQKSMREGDFSWPLRTFNWTFAADFGESIRRHGFAHEHAKATALLRALAEVVLNSESRKSHPLRINKQGGSGQQVRTADNARAMRHDVGYEYHVHYWRTEVGPEFTSVGPHNDFSIDP